jgi:shikimate dehydrogenase
MVSGRTRLVGIIGDPVDHIRGFTEYAEALAAAGLDAAYLPLHVPAGRLAAFLAGAAELRNLAGLICTIPHKQVAVALAVPDAAARRAGSANLLRPRADGGWDATMLDGAGFLAASDVAGIGFAGRAVQLLGAGGAGRAVAMAIADRGPASLALHDPDAARAAALRDAVARGFPGLPVTCALGVSEVLVNCSPIGLGHDTRLPLPAELIPAAVHDIVNRPDTPLLLAARARGALAIDGSGMMLAQVPLLLRFLFGDPPR